MLTGTVYYNAHCNNAFWANIINPNGIGYGTQLAAYFGSTSRNAMLPLRVGKRRCMIPLVNHTGTGGSWLPATPRLPPA